jgi:hypothetical protein
MFTESAKQFMKLTPKTLSSYLAVAATTSVLVGITTKSAFAVSLTWTLQNVTFSDGSTATGTFEYDATTDVYSNWNITVSESNTIANLPTFTYNPTSSTIGEVDPTSGSFIPASSASFLQLSSNQLSNFDANGSRKRQLRLPFFTSLTDAGGTIALDNSNLPNDRKPLFTNKGIECWNCFPFRVITGGQVTALGVTQIPEPHLGKWSLVGLLGLGLLTKYQSWSRRDKI